jgi:hypothetical protein
MAPSHWCDKHVAACYNERDEDDVEITSVHGGSPGFAINSQNAFWFRGSWRFCGIFLKLPNYRRHFSPNYPPRIIE